MKKTEPLKTTKGLEIWKKVFITFYLDLRLRFIREEQKNIEQEINDEKQLHKSLIDEYELKKTNLQSRVDWAQKLDELIEQQKRLI